MNMFLWPLSHSDLPLSIIHGQLQASGIWWDYTRVFVLMVGVYEIGFRLRPVLL